MLLQNQKNLELLENLKKWFNFEVWNSLFFIMFMVPNQIRSGEMATVIGIFEEQFIKNRKSLTIVKPGTQTRRFTHVWHDTVNICYEAWKKR